MKKKLIEEIKVKLTERFKMKDIGRVGKYIGIEVKYDSEKGEMSLSQENYIQSLEKKYNLIDAKKYNTPMEANLKVYPASEVDVKIKYRNLIGELLYISTGTRPNIAISVNYLSRFQDSYDETIYKYALRVLKYLCRTKCLKLVFGIQPVPQGPRAFPYSGNTYMREREPCQSELSTRLSTTPLLQGTPTAHRNAGRSQFLARRQRDYSNTL